MTYQLFVEKVCTQLNLILDGSVYAEPHTSLKNNNISRIGITITNPEINISPTMYIEDFYEQYKNGCSIHDIAFRILEVYDEIRFDHSWDLSDITDFESISGKIAYKLIHFEKNRPFLQTVPHLRYQDLAIVFFLFVEIDCDDSGTILITNEMMHSWDITIDTLYHYAAYNTKLLFPAEFKPMCAVICDMLGTACSHQDFLDDHMYVLTNSENQFGAATLLYDDLLEDIGSHLQDDYYILPCSIHELIIIPRRFSPSVPDLSAMVSEINETELSEDEFLTDQIYYFSRIHNTLLFTS